MIIEDNKDFSIIRANAIEESIPITEFIMNKIKLISEKEQKNITLLAVCPNSESVLKAALRSAKRVNAPIKFAATLNQVDFERGYTGWTQNDLIRKIKEESFKIGYNGPIIIAVDHGGPWVKDSHVSENFDYEKAMNWVKKSFEEALKAGYDLLHIDPTVDPFNKKINIETVVDRTFELIKHIENFRKSQNISPISYEVGTEEVHGGLVDIKVFKKFLFLLKNKLESNNLDYVWPIFIVAKVGTDLHTTLFDPNIAKKVVKIASEYNSFIKGHYTDFVTNPEDYPESGIGAANVGPEFTIAEYEALEELSKIELPLYKKNKVAYTSRFMKILTKTVLDSGRWKKWLHTGEDDFNNLSQVRKNWIIKTSCRYIWAAPEVISSRLILFNNLRNNGIDPENWVLMKIESCMDRYFQAFNLIDLNKKINNM